MHVRRTTTRRLMLAIAVVAASLGAWRLAVDRRAFLAEAAYHARRESEEMANLSLMREARARGHDFSSGPAGAKLEESSRLRAAFHAEWKRIYESAAARPWTPPPSRPEEPGAALIWDAFIPDAIEIEDHDFPMIPFDATTGER